MAQDAQSEVSHPAAQRAGRRGGDKRRAVLDGALAVFARDGYSRASIDTIAAEAGVSTRTIYNHFGGKATLFQAVIQDSADAVATAQVATLQRYLTKISDIEADLLEFGRIWASPVPEFLAHFTLVRQVAAEVGHIPQAALDAWQESGPLRVRRELARLLEHHGRAGKLTIDDPELAAIHLVNLVAGEVNARTNYGATPLAPEEIHRLSDAGVRTFLHGHLPTRATTGTE